MGDDRLKHFSHFHTLRFRMVSDEETDIICCLCKYQICGPAYTCNKDYCSFWLHKSCSELPRVIEKHPFHSAHPLLYLPDLYLEDKNFICDGCGQLSSKYKFVCEGCNFSLDFKCASITDKEVEAGTRCSDVKTTKLHFSHEHNLIHCIVRKQLELKCLGCKEVLSGPTYACLGCQFFFHETCLNDIPEKIEHHPFHPHRLLPNPYSKIASCIACTENIRGISFSCEQCNFDLHASCAKYQTRAIKHKLHEHDLLYFGPRNIGRRAKCNACGEDCNSSFFCCISCQLDLHLECFPLPLTVKHSRHPHLLRLEDFIKNGSEEYYCDICGTERNSEHHIYYCKECDFTVHIDCVISEVEPPEEIYSSLIPRTKKVVLNKVLEDSTI